MISLKDSLMYNVRLRESLINVKDWHKIDSSIDIDKRIEKILDDVGFVFIRCKDASDAAIVRYSDNNIKELKRNGFELGEYTSSWAKKSGAMITSWNGIGFVEGVYTDIYDNGIKNIDNIDCIFQLKNVKTIKSMLYALKNKVDKDQKFKDSDIIKIY